MTAYIDPQTAVLDVSLMEAAEGRPFDCNHKRVAAAISILGRFFGPNWLDSRLRLTKRKGDSFLYPQLLNPLDEFKRDHRLVTLAEHLLNLQRVEGFETCLKEIDRDKIETGLAKLIAARMLHFRGIEFKFVTTSGQKGKDYDAEATVAGTVVAVEMKAKVEGKSPRRGAISNSLKVARKQVPKNTPNLVFLRVPDSWGFDERVRQQIAAEVASEFENSSTLNAVAVHWERWSQLVSPNSVGGGLAHDRFMVIVSGRARTQLPELAQALLRFDDAASSAWITLEALVCRPEELAHLVPAAPEGGLPFYLDKLTILGPARLAYAHFCARVFPDAVLRTWERVRSVVHIGAGEENKLPEGSTLVLRVEERGPSLGSKVMTVLFGRQGEKGEAQQEEGELRQVDCEPVALGPNSPRIATFALDVSGFKLNGPGLYSFDFVLGDQLLGRLSILAYRDRLPDARVGPSPFAGDRITLRFGHVLSNLLMPDAADAEGGVTFQRVVDVVGLKESNPFAVDPGVLVLGLSAPEGFPTDHVVEVVARRSDGTLLGNTQGSIVLQPGLPGELVACPAISLSGVVFPGEGDYEFLVKVDGKETGVVTFFVRVVGSEVLKPDTTQVKGSEG